MLINIIGGQKVTAAVTLLAFQLENIIKECEKAPIMDLKSCK